MPINIILMEETRCKGELTNQGDGGKITTMETQTIKIRKATLKKLRLIYALTDKSMLSILERLITAELKRIQLSETDEDSQKGSEL